MSLPIDHPRLVKRPFTRGELIADGVIHGVAILAAIIGLVVLIGLVVARHGGLEVTATAVYGFALLAMLGFSCAYNMVPASDLKWILRRFDHSAIYLMIAGTYTPLVTRFDDGFWACTLAIVVWAGAILGIVVKLVLPGRFDRLSIVAYVALGLVVLVAIEPMRRSLPPTSVSLVAIGGGLYISGIAFYLWKSLKFHNAIWHGFVVTAVFCHFAAITHAMVATA